jgi:hypothetical protein
MGSFTRHERGKCRNSLHILESGMYLFDSVKNLLLHNRLIANGLAVFMPDGIFFGKSRARAIVSEL